MPRNLNPRIAVNAWGTGANFRISADCPTCGDSASSTWNELPLTMDGRIDLSGVTLLCERCYPRSREVVPRDELPSGVTHAVRTIRHPDAKPFKIGA